jgi:hypothetical protein
MKDILIIADLDGTLVLPDEERDAMTAYMSPIYIDRCHYTYKYFIESECDKVVLTVRHPNTRDIVERAIDWRGVIHFRDYCLEYNEIEESMTSGKSKFYQGMVEFKRKMINLYADIYQSVLVIDDRDIIVDMDGLKDNVYTMYPLE